MITRISSSPHSLPPANSHILSAKNERYSSERVKSKSAPSRYKGASIHSSVKKTHSLEAKDLYNRAGIDHIKRQKIMDQLQNRLKRTIVTAEGGSSFRRVWNILAQRNFDSLCSK